MSVQDSRARKDCGLQGIADNVSDERFRGLRIFDISDATRPRQVGPVQTCRGSHTHSVVSADADRDLTRRLDHLRYIKLFRRSVNPGCGVTDTLHE